MLTTQALVIALRLSLAVLAAQLLFLVLFDWRNFIPHQASMPRVGRWWRTTCGTFGAGMLLALSNNIAALNHPFIFSLATREWMLMLGLSLLNASAASAHSGLLVARGATTITLWFTLTIPAGFVLLTLWVLR